MGFPQTNHFAGSGTHPRDLEAIGCAHPSPAGTDGDGGRHSGAARRILSIRASRFDSPVRNRRRLPESRIGRTMRLRSRLVRKREPLPSPRRIDPPGKGAPFLPGENHPRRLRGTFGAAGVFRRLIRYPSLFLPRRFHGSRERSTPSIPSFGASQAIRNPGGGRSARFLLSPTPRNPFLEQRTKKCGIILGSEASTGE